MVQVHVSVIMPIWYGYVLRLWIVSSYLNGTGACCVCDHAFVVQVHVVTVIMPMWYRLMLWLWSTGSISQVHLKGVPLNLGGAAIDVYGVEQYDACREAPCYNGGRCEIYNNAYGFRCQCPRGFAGQRCERTGFRCYPGQSVFSHSLFSVLYVGILVFIYFTFLFVVTCSSVSLCYLMWNSIVKIIILPYFFYFFLLVVMYSAVSLLPHVK